MTKSLYSKSFDLILWYGFTFIGLFYLKRYMNEIFDPHAFTFITLGYGAFLKLFNREFDTIKSELSVYIYLALLNISSILLSVISIGQTSLGFFFLTKLTEPIFSLVLSYIFIGKKSNTKVLLIFLPSCVSLLAIIFNQSINMSSFGLIVIVFANIASSSFNIFTKIYYSSSKLSIYSYFINVYLVSFLLFMPVYFVKISILNNKIEPASPLEKTLNYENNFNTMKYFFIGSIYVYLYKFYSVNFLLSSRTEIYSLINSMRTFFIIALSFITLASNLNTIQIISIIFINIGILFNSILNIRYEPINVIISKNRREYFKKALFSLLTFLIFLSFFININQFKSVEDYSSLSNNINIANDRQNRFNFNFLKQQSRNDLKIYCVNKTKESIINIFKNFVPFDNYAVLIDLPYSDTTDDSILWMGEEELIKSLNLVVKFRLTSQDLIEKNKKILLLNKVDKKYTIFMHASGRLGDSDRFYSCKRNNIIDWFSSNQIVFFPEFVKYTNSNSYDFSTDNRFYSSNPNLIMTFKSENSYYYAYELYKSTNIVFVPDITYVIGNIEPTNKPLYDIVIIRNMNRESVYPFVVWQDAYNEFLSLSYSYRDVDWIKYNRFRANQNDLTGCVKKRTDFAINVISIGKVVITDRLQISILCILMGKPHVLVDDLSNNMIKTRDAAFMDYKEKCNSNSLSSFSSNDPRDAVLKAIQILDNYEYFE